MFSQLSPLPLLRRDVRFTSFGAPLALAATRKMSGNDSENGRSNHGRPSPAKGSEQAVVRIPDAEDNLTITLSIDGRVRTLNRPKGEELRRSLHRLRLSLLPEKRRGKTQRDAQETSNSIAEQATVALYVSDSETRLVDEALPNDRAWPSGRWLVAGGNRYEVVTNPPTVKQVRRYPVLDAFSIDDVQLLVNERPIVGHPIFPLCELEFAEESACLWQWFVRRSKGDAWTRLEATDRIYAPTRRDTGCFLGVECTPISEIPADGEALPAAGEPRFAENGPVAPEVEKASGDGRHELTPRPLEAPSFRLVTYNVLADSYVSRPNAKSVFGYCHQRDLDIDVRKQLVLKELIGYHADVICLQECDKKVFDAYYAHHLHAEGFSGFFAQKSGTTREGEAFFVRRSRFEVAGHVRLHMNDALNGELPAYLLPFREMIAASKNMREALKSVVTIGQAVLLKPRGTPGMPLCVVNTHLISHAHGEHVRLFHVLKMLHEAKDWARSLEADAQVVLVGDLNSSVDLATGLVDASVTLLRDGRIGRDHWEWSECRKFSWSKMTPEDDVSRLYESADEEERDPIEGIDLETPFELRSALSLETPYTNYTDGFKGLLDYVWYEPRFVELEREIPLPSPERIGKPCPSNVYPSDHLAVVVDLRFKEEEAGTVVGREAADGVVLPADAGNVERGAEALEKGGLVGLPTDTLYGLAADAGSADAVAALYAVKGRSSGVPLAVCVAERRDVSDVCETQHLPEGMLDALLPGPVTVVLGRKETPLLSPDLNPGLPTIGVRVPDSEFVRRLCGRLQRPIALTSANRSGEPSSVCVSDFRDLWKECAVVFDGGRSSSSCSGSTVVDLSSPGEYRILRSGDGLESVLDAAERFGLRKASG